MINALYHKIKSFSIFNINAIITSKVGESYEQKTQNPDFDYTGICTY